MKNKSFSLNGVGALCYLVLLYYLLPFRPSYLYYASQHSGENALQQTEGATAVLKSANFFPQKIKVRFCFDFFLPRTPVLESIVFNVSSEQKHYSASKYLTPSLLPNSNRGPPAA
jgi:hypothetical protein